MDATNLRAEEEKQFKVPAANGRREDKKTTVYV